jgi:hypothetical protein
MIILLKNVGVQNMKFKPMEREIIFHPNQNTNGFTVNHYIFIY